MWTSVSPCALAPATWSSSPAHGRAVQVDPSALSLEVTALSADGTAGGIISLVTSPKLKSLFW